MEQKGIVETKEILIAFLKLLPLLIKDFKDGIQAKDIVTVFQAIEKNEELKNALVEAYNKSNEMPEELKDISVLEGLELVGVIIKEFPFIYSELKK